ncbi:2-oxo acid dehydrogenase subunit E2 [Candidatus Harpocratesius sp.]
MGRYDGTKIKLPPFKRIEAHLMQRRCDSLVYYTAQYDLSKTLPYIEEYNKKHNLDKSERLTLFQLFLLACSRAIAQHPKVNRFITGRNYYQRNRINIAFVVKKKLTLEGKSTMMKMDFHPFDTIESVRHRFHHLVHRARSDKGNDTEGLINFFGKLPRGILMFLVKILKFIDFLGLMPKDLIEGDPLFSSAIVANLGSVGLSGTIIHHLYEWGNASVFLTLNRIRKIPVVNEETDQIEIHKVVDVGVAIDERIAEGIYFHYTLSDLKTFIENPKQLEIPSSISPETLAELKLRDFSSLPHIDLARERSIGAMFAEDLTSTTIEHLS